MVNSFIMSAVVVPSSGKSKSHQKINITKYLDCMLGVVPKTFLNCLLHTI